MEEQWKNIGGYPDYQVSDHGRVRRTSYVGRGRRAKDGILKPKLQSGALKVSLYNQDSPSYGDRIPISRLVYAAFIGEIPEKMSVTHVDTNDRTNDRPSNLMLLPFGKHVSHYYRENREISEEPAFIPQEKIVSKDPIKKEWRPVPEFEGVYEVSNFGEIKRIGGGANAKIGENRSFSTVAGYSRVQLSNAGFIRTLQVHIIVAEAFLGPRPSDNYTCNHINGNMLDNRVTNLEWITRAENTQHATKFGLQKRAYGEANPASKVNSDQVREIRRLNAEGKLTQKEMAAMFGISQASLSKIVLNQTWKNLDANTTPDAITILPNEEGAEWRPVWGCYEVSNRGHVRKDGKTKKARQDYGGYLVVTCSIAGKTNRTSYAIHLAVAEAFLGSRPSPNHVVNHIDGCKTNNLASNLEWITYKENSQHAADTGLITHHKGEAHATSKLTDEDVYEIRKLADNGTMSQETIGKMYGIGQKQVSSIYMRKSWGHLPEKPALK